MALKKTVSAKNGIVTEYHRIAMISVEVNQQNTIFRIYLKMVVRLRKIMPKESIKISILD